MNEKNDNRMDEREILNTRMKVLSLYADSDWSSATAKSLGEVLDNSSNIKTTVDWLLENLNPTLKDEEVLQIIKNAP